LARAIPAKKPPISIENPTYFELTIAASPNTHARLTKKRVSGDFATKLTNLGKTALLKKIIPKK
jgi:hypothetical protein